MSTHPVTIILAEDDEGHAQLIQRSLKRVGFVNEVVHVQNGQEVLDYIFAQGDFAGRVHANRLLILLDINMPRMDGIETLRQLKARESTRSIPVVMLTTTDDPNEIERCYQLGCGVYITKPVDGERFSEAINKLGLFLQVVKVPPEHVV
ncbi:MAG: response regulator [Pseudomonadota bacterium]